ncbi:hypothetical protein GC194_12710 [bacterium]|nr:hypothetical protein [bacterium]
MQRLFTLTLSILLISSGITSAQRKKKLDIDWAKPFKANNYTYVRPVGADGNDYYFCDLNFKVLGKGQVDLYKCDMKNPDDLETNTISDKSDGRFDLISYGGVCMGNKTYIYNEYSDKATKTLGIELTEVDKNLGLSGKPRVINKLTDVDMSDIIASLSASSPNGEYHAILTTSKMTFGVSDYLRAYPGIGFIMSFFPRSKKYYRRQNAVTVFNNSGEVVWEKSFYLGAKKELHDIREINVTDKGDVVFFGTSSDDRSILSSFAYEQNYSKKYNQLYYMNSGLSEPVITKLDWGEGFRLFSLYFTIGEHEVHCAASVDHINSKKKWEYYGVKIMKIGFDGNGIRTIDIPMDYSFFNTELSKSDKRNLEKGKSLTIGTPIVRYLGLKSNGNYNLCVEERTLIVKTRTSSSGTVTNNYDYHFENAALVEVDDNGEVVWKHVIEKDQYLYDKYLQGSMFIHHTDEAMYVFYNAGKSGGKYTDADKISNIQVLKIADDGKVLFDDDILNKSVPIMPEYCRVINNMVCFSGINKRDHGLGFLNLDDI